MISLHTNIPSLITQNNLNVSTNKLNQAIERMSTGYKINHASDNAANYSISTDMSTQLSACDIAADNIAMGMDLVNVAQDTIAGMQSRASRIHALITQARNGTYGAASLTAMTQEAQAIAAEINRLHANTEYNGIKLFELPLPDWAQEVKNTAGKINGKTLEECAAANGGFIADVIEDTPDVTVIDPTQLASAISGNTKIGIGNAKTLAKLAELVNSGTTCEGKTIVLTDDIDLSDYQEGEGWTPIGDNHTSSDDSRFKGNFNGNGHKVTGLYINRNADFQGLFGHAAGQLKNVAVVDSNVTGKSYIGGLTGWSSSIITNCYTTGNVTGTGRNTGGLTGRTGGVINSYATGNVTGAGDDTGGLAGSSGESNVTNCFATGNVTGSGYYTGGLVGISTYAVKNSYATGNVKGTVETGGLAGRTQSSITNCCATGNVTGTLYTGGLAGYTCYVVRNSYATGNVTGTSWVGGLVGQLYSTSNWTCKNIFSTGTVSGNAIVGNLIGGIVNTTDGTSFSTITLTNASARQGEAMIGFEGRSNGTAYESGQMEGWLENITALDFDTNLQVGINGDSNSRISFDTKMNINLNIRDLTSDSAYESINNFLNLLSEKSTQLGAAQNRLESALESNLVKMDNLTSSLSTIRDADISKVSSNYIRQQILQQACATLLSTANQSPSIALQLL